MRRRKQRRAVTAWLGLLALVLQVLVPLLVAGEIAAAAKAGDSSVFELCLFGHLHEVTAPHGTGTSGGADRHTNAADLCPICIALHASPVFTAPVATALPLPMQQEIGVSLPAQRQPAKLATPAAYRSRAPPIG
jgi:hypothetical protein